MPASVDEWSDQYWDRSFARHTSQVETAKLIVTFALAIAATIVATALQVTGQFGWDLAAVIVLAVAFLLALAAIVLDRLKWPSRELVLQEQQINNWSDNQLLDYVRLLMRDANKENDLVVRKVRTIAGYQVLVSGVAATLAAVSLFR